MGNVNTMFRTSYDTALSLSFLWFLMIVSFPPRRVSTKFIPNFSLERHNHTKKKLQIILQFYVQRYNHHFLKSCSFLIPHILINGPINFQVTNPKILSHFSFLLTQSNGIYIATDYICKSVISVLPLTLLSLV